MTSQANFTPENISDDESGRGFRTKTRNNFNYLQIALNSFQSWVQNALEDLKSTIIKPAIRGGFAVNDIRYYGTLSAAVANIPSTSSQTVHITSALSIAADLTVPANISIVMAKGGSFAIASGKVLTFNGSFDSQGNALSDLFSGSGSYRFGKAVRLVGTGSPEGAVYAPVGSEFLRTDGGATSTLYIKESGTGNTGWTSPASGAPIGSGTAGKLAKWATSSSLTDSIVTESGAAITVGGTVQSSNIRVGGAPSSAQGISVDGIALTSVNPIGILSQPAFPSSATGSANAADFQFRTAASSFTVATGRGLYIESPLLGSGSAVTTLIGLEVGNQTGGGTNYAIKTGSGSISLGDTLTFNQTSGSGGGDASIWRSAGAGLAVRGVAGSSYDYALFNPSANYLMRNPTGTQSLEFPGTGTNTFAGAVSMSSTLTVTSNISSTTGFFYSSLVTKPTFILNATGSNYGYLANVTSTTWALGYGTSQTALGTSALTWDATGAVSLSSTLAVAGAITGQSSLALTGASGTLTVGNTAQTISGINVSSLLTGLTGTDQRGISATPTFSSAATTMGRGLLTQVRTAAAAFTMTDGIGLNILDANKGSGSAIATLYGIKVEDQTGGGTNYALKTGQGQVQLSDYVGIGTGGPANDVGLYITAVSNFSSATALQGFMSDVTYPATATSSIRAARARVRTSASSYTVTNAIGVNIDTPIKGASSSITNGYGLKVEDQTQGSTANYAIYSGSGQVRFGDNVFAEGTGLGYWINTPGTFTYGMYTTGTSLAFRSGSTTPWLTIDSSGQPTFSTAATFQQNVSIAANKTLALGTGTTLSIGNNSGFSIGSGSTVTLSAATTISGHLAIGSAAIVDGASTISLVDTLGGATTDGAGVYIDVTSSTNTSAVHKGISIRAQTQAGSYTVNSNYGAYIRSSVKGSGSTLTNNYGLYIENQTVGSSNYAIKTNTGTVELGDILRLGPAAALDDIFLINLASVPSRTPSIAGIRIQYTATSSHTSEIIGIATSINGATSTAVTNAYALQIGAISAGSGGSITNNYGLWVGDVTSGTNKYAIKTGLGLISIGDNATITKSINGNLILSINNSSNGASATSLLEITAGGTSANFNGIQFDVTGNSNVFLFGMSPSSQAVVLQTGLGGTAFTASQGSIAGYANLALFGSGSFGGGNSLLFINNTSSPPTSNPSGGGLLFADSGALKWRGSSGTITTIAPA